MHHKMMVRFPTSTIGIIFVVIILLPRHFGLLSGSCNIQTRQISQSKFWRIYALFCGFSFTILYPLSIYTISPKIKAISQVNVFTFIEISNHVATYVFSVAVFVTVVCGSAKHIHFMNFAFSTFDQCKELVYGNKENAFLLSFAVRVIYLYFGYATLNAVSLIQYQEHLESVPFIYKCVYFAPDMVMASTMLRFHTAISVQVICCHRLNKAFSECMDRVKQSRMELPTKRFKTQFYARQQFGKIVKCHSRLYEFSRKSEELASILMLFYVLKAFAYISSMVSDKNNLISICLKTASFQLFLLIDHLSSSLVWDTNFIVTATLRCLFSLLDIIFTFTPANQLKREYFEVGIAVFKGSQGNLLPELQKSVSEQLFCFRFNKFV